MTREKFFESMGWVGMVTAVLMYVFYFPQIVSNLSGERVLSYNRLWQVSTVRFGWHTDSLRRSATCP